LISSFSEPGVGFAKSDWASIEKGEGIPAFDRVEGFDPGSLILHAPNDAQVLFVICLAGAVSDLIVVDKTDV
jgi:hypothetical protein